MVANINISYGIPLYIVVFLDFKYNYFKTY